ncbi:hypothetical protein STCU_09406 [Strigomonas culicis]|uniref:Uncharacterized protein n=1 Tax=Strigomonas culicis TaxID=28005 RepID=S9TSN9_9TRYP|nr:hypothetical protein STCU_09406 [Strigomonas culicis]|eukprot:EPY19518.1 hypothetical protein STCU_09406 [Strigomonas culicis]
MIGGSTVANENFLRLTTHTLDDHGFAFNTAPLDHANWEARIQLSVRPPGPAARDHDPSVKYQGGDGMAFWYLQQPIGDDHQHVPKYSKVVTAELLEENLERDNPWRLADAILQDDADEDFDDAVDEEDLTDAERRGMQAARAKRELKRKQREDLFRRLFRRGTSFDAGDEPRVMGVKHADFASGFAVVLDSVGPEGTHRPGEDAHHAHRSTISLLLNVPNHTASAGQKVVNNFNGGRADFRQSPRLLQCDYDFRQEGARAYNPDDASLSPAARALKAPGEPIELVVRYYEKKLSIIIRREVPEKRKIIEEGKEGVDVERTYRETLCGELYPLLLPQRYHFGLSAATATGRTSSGARSRWRVSSTVSGTRR